MTLAEPANLDPLRVVQAATTDAQGNYSITFPTTPIGSRWVVSVSIIDAPAGAVFTASLMGQPFHQWAGASSEGPLTLNGNETLAVKGSGLTAMTNFQAVMVGTQGPPALLDPAVPSSAPTSVQAGPQPRGSFGSSFTISNNQQIVILPNIHAAANGILDTQRYRVYEAQLSGWTTAGFGDLFLNDDHWQFQSNPLPGSNQAFASVSIGSVATTPGPLVPVPAGFLLTHGGQVILQASGLGANTAHASVTVLFDVVN